MEELGTTHIMISLKRKHTVAADSRSQFHFPPSSHAPSEDHRPQIRSRQTHDRDADSRSHPAPARCERILRIQHRVPPSPTGPSEVGTAESVEAFEGPECGKTASRRPLPFYLVDRCATGPQTRPRSCRRCRDFRPRSVRNGFTPSVALYRSAVLEIRARLLGAWQTLLVSLQAIHRPSGA